MRTGRDERHCASPGLNPPLRKSHAPTGESVTVKTIARPRVDLTICDGQNCDFTLKDNGTAMDLDKPILFAATTNADRSRAFYETALGLEFVSDDPFALVFKTGPNLLRIQKVDRKPKIGYTVLGWAVTDIKKTVRRLAKAGIEFQRYDGLDQDADGIWTSPSGALVAWFRDPDDNTLSLTQYPRSRKRGA